MDVVCVATCMTGIVHTYIARERLIKRVRALGRTIKAGAQRTTGTENELQAADISATNVVILAVDVKIKGEERSTNKRTVRVRIEIVIRSPAQFLEKVRRSLGNK